MKVLIAEDELIACRELEKSIRDWGYETVIAKNGKEAWERVKTDEIRLAVLDWMMPGMNGVELCRKIRQEFQEKKSKYIYIILLTGRDQQGDVITGLSAGADDYITKPYSFLELKIRLQNGERIIELEDNRLKLASYDSLTKLWNRNKILDFFKEELERSRRENQSTGLIMMDIDHFKKINDSYGHHTGDVVLVEVALRLKKSIRKYDKVGRYGGDEMIVVLPDCSQASVRKIAQRLLQCIAEEKIKTEKTPLDVTISAGGVSSDNFPLASSEELIQASDRALYAAKEKGRNCTVILDNINAEKTRSLCKAGAFHQKHH
ncbi:MAG: diguanylate cyclase [Candidatus Aminicenantes bacterium]